MRDVQCKHCIEYKGNWCDKKRDDPDQEKDQEKLKEAARMAELKPCPFCGGTAFTTYFKTNFGQKMFIVVCEYCGSEGMHSKSEQKAIAAWNRRADNGK